MHLFTRHTKITAGDARQKGVGFCSLGKRLYHRSMGNITLISTLGGRDVLQFVEVGTPVVGYRRRVVEVLLVEFFYVGGVAAEQIRVLLEELHHAASPFTRVSRERCGQDHATPPFIFRPGRSMNRYLNCK